MAEIHGWHFASFRLDQRAERLWGRAEAIHLTAKAFGVLRYLVEHAGQLVTKDDLFAAVRGAPYVSEAALAACIRELRQALDDTAQTPKYIETVRGRGYRPTKRSISIALVRQEAHGRRVPMTEPC
jgi:DNA-binding winged helix-turn-helix (wHTH) protein